MSTFDTDILLYIDIKIIIKYNFLIVDLNLTRKIKMDYNINRFIEAQEETYLNALDEIKDGIKRTHWMWFIFPQHKDLGYSSTSKFYGISDLEEAKQYLAHPILWYRLCEVSTELLKHKDKTIVEILGPTDALKLKSSMTLFDIVEPNSVFNDILNTFYEGERDIKTLQLLEI